MGTAPRKSKRKSSKNNLETKQKRSIKNRRKSYMNQKYISKGTLNIRKPKNYLSLSKKSENQMHDHSQPLNIENSQSSDAVGVDLETNDGCETVRVCNRTAPRKSKRKSSKNNLETKQKKSIKNHRKSCMNP